MKFEMLMPQMGESIAEATVIRWHKNVGDSVKKDETILEISTDKVDSEIPSPESGIITEILAPEGKTVAVKSVVAIIDTAASPGSVPAKKATIIEAVAEKAEEVAPPSPPPVSAPQVSATQIPPSAPPPVAATSTSFEAQSQASGRVYSPLVKNIAAQHGIGFDELSQIPGSGTHGRLTKEDLLHYIEHGNVERPHTPTAQAQYVAPQAATTPPVAPQAPAVPAKVESYGPGTKIEPFDTMRKAIAEHMVRSKHTSPHVYSVAEIDVTNIGKWRKREQNAFKEREGFGLSYTPFFLEAVVRGLTEYPKINASIEGDNLIIKRDINLGCAVALGDDGLGGLIVPNIKNAGSLNFAGIARGLNDIASRARSKKLKPEDVQGGTFTVTNVGVFGNIIGYPIISQPQLAILALGAIKKRPVVVDDAIAIRDICYLTLSYDHRAIDGAMAGHFLKYITDYLQNWDMNRTI